MEWQLAGENEVVGENLLKCHFVQQKSHNGFTWDQITTGKFEIWLLTPLVKVRNPLSPLVPR
jgi:hypothetical protein